MGDERTKTEAKIVEVGTALARFRPNDEALLYARKWWKDGRQIGYPGQDEDVLDKMRKSLSYEILNS